MKKKTKRITKKSEKNKRQLYGYICGIDSQDIALGANDVVIFSSIEALKKARGCWKECGIDRINISKREVVVKGTFPK